MAEDPYTTLGVARDASADDIRRAYRRLAKQHHPDLNPGNKAAEERFKSISAANELLGDAEKRENSIAARSMPAARRPHPGRPIATTPKAPRVTATGVPARHPMSTSTSTTSSAICSVRVRLAAARGLGVAATIATADHRFLEAVNGAAKRLTLPDGRTLDVKVPVGVEEGQTLRRAARAVPAATARPPVTR